MYNCNDCLDGILVKVCCPELQPDLHAICIHCKGSYPFPLEVHHTFDECWGAQYLRQEDEREQIIVIEVITTITVIIDPLEELRKAIAALNNLIVAGNRDFAVVESDYLLNSLGDSVLPERILNVF